MSAKIEQGSPARLSLTLFSLQTEPKANRTSHSFLTRPTGLIPGWYRPRTIWCGSLCLAPTFIREGQLGNHGKRRVGHFCTVEYTTPVRYSPHSMQRAFNRDVINPQDGHILCVPWAAAIRGFRSRLLRSSRIANSAISKPTTRLVAFIKATLLRDSRIVGRNVTSASGRASRARSLWKADRSC